MSSSVGERGHPDHAGLARAGRRRSRRVRPTPSTGSRPAFTATTGLARREPPGQAAEVAGLPNDSMYMHDDVGAARRPPSTGAGRCRTRRPGCRGRRTTRCRRPPRGPGAMIAAPTMPDSDSSDTPPRQRDDVGEGGVQAHRRVGVDDAEAVRARPRGSPTSGPTRSTSASSAAPSGPASANPAERITTPYTCLRPHSSTTAATDGGRHGDHGQVDVVGDVEDARHGPDAWRRGAALRVHRPHRALRSRRAAGCGRTSWPTRARVAAGADDGDAARRQQPPHGLGGRRAGAARRWPPRPPASAAGRAAPRRRRRRSGWPSRTRPA